MVIAQLRSFFSSSQKREAQELYITLVQQSRKPFFYTDCAVPDTLDGRFDVIVLHIYLMLRHLKEKTGQEMLSRLLQESLFADMDRSLREMGVGDTGVAKRVQTMSKAVYGRLEAYTKAWDKEAELSEALKRNVYRGNEVAPSALDALVQYMRGYEPVIAASI
jgi:cytochrome b pre-mRNA-processing protein 3